MNVRAEESLNAMTDPLFKPLTINVKRMFAWPSVPLRRLFQKRIVRPMAGPCMTVSHTK
jgi:hypothetical protein